MIIEGRQIAEEIYRSLEEEVRRLENPPRLGVVVYGGDAAALSYVRLKERIAHRLGVSFERVELEEGVSTDEIIQCVRDLSHRADGIVVQLPLPHTAEVEEVLSAIPLEKDVDALSPYALREREVASPVVQAVREILKRANTRVEGSHAVVVGAGRLVGAPVAEFLKESRAEVEVLTKDDSLDALQNADVVVLGAGEPHMVVPEMLKDGVVLVDAGTSEMSGKVVGDADPRCAEKASVFTPVPGGVGPIAVAKLFENLLILTEKR